MIFIGVLILVFVGFAAYVRLAPEKAEQYSGTPSTIESDGKPHEYRLIGESAPQFALPAETLAAQFDDYVLAQPRTKRIDGTHESLQKTYIQRTQLMGYPDYISIEIDAIDENNSRLNILSRSRFGKSDLGANEKRVTSWLQGFRAALPAAQ